MGVSAGSGKVFNWFANMTSIAGLLTWFGISYTYIRFYAGMKAQGIDRQTLPFSSRLQPYAAWYSAIFCIVICVVRVNCYHNLSFHSRVGISIHTVQRVVRLPPRPMGHSQLYYKLFPCPAVPDIVHRREVLETCSPGRTITDGFLHGTCGDRGKHLR